jgi:hypothetical protein
MKSSPADKTASHRQGKPLDTALARIEVKRAGSIVYLCISGDGVGAAPLIRQFVESLNGRSFSLLANDNPVFKRPIRLESVGLDDEERVESIVLEADATSVVLQVAGDHERRAAAFCQRHRHFTTTESMDDLAAEFERVARQGERDGRQRAFLDTSEWCVKEAKDSGGQR